MPPKPNDWSPDRPWPFDSSGQLWIGDSGTLVAGTYGENPHLSDEKKHAALIANPPAIKYPRVKSVYQEWADAIRAGTQPGSNFPGHAAPLTEMVLLGNLALKLSVYNPNGYRLDATRMTYNVAIGEDVQLASGALDSRFTVQSGDSTLVTVPVSFSFSGLKTERRCRRNAAGVCLLFVERARDAIGNQLP